MTQATSCGRSDYLAEGTVCNLRSSGRGASDRPTNVIGYFLPIMCGRLKAIGRAILLGDRRHAADTIDVKLTVKKFFIDSE
jgi:hypothetical protein